MTDLKVLSIKDVLPITAVEYSTKVTPLSILIQGENFDQATEVYINDLVAPEFMILSSNRIIAQVPDSARNSILRQITVLAEKPSTKRNSLLHFDIGISFKGLKGIERMVQFFCKLLLQTPGSDKFNPEDGGGLLTAIGKNVSKNDKRSAQMLASSAVLRTRDQILTKQSQASRIPADERLLDAITEAVGFDPETTTLTVRVALTAASGRQAVANLTF
jgi:hypothetical protein